MNKIIIPLVIISVLAAGIGLFFVFQKPLFPEPQTLLTPSNGGDTQQKTTTQPNESTTLIYHGVVTHSWSNLVTPGGNQTENIKAEVNAYEAAVGRTVAFVEFAHEWDSDGGTFPSDVVTSIKNRGATPLIFLNLRTIDIGQTDPVYNLAAINAGQFDSKLEAWADEAKNFGSELIVDWGWEMNGDFTPWNGTYNGGTIEGPKNYRKAYRHIIELMRNRGASNIRWAFHVNFPESPVESWNAFENYYPGDDVIDIIGVSIYSAQFPTDDFFPSFKSLMDPAYSRLNQMAPKKPVFVFEFGAATGNPLGSSVTWANDALSGILSGRWVAVRGFAWWNDYWSQDDNPAHDTEMRVEKLPELAQTFQSYLSDKYDIGDRPPIFTEKLTLKPTTPIPLPTETTLKALAEKHGIRFGAYYNYDRRGSRHDEIFEREMNVMTAGEFLVGGSQTSPTEFDFTEMDTKVNWALERNMEVHAHTLVWYDDIPDWIKTAPLNEVEDIMNARIDAYVGRYAGKVKLWDVVNEGVNDGIGAEFGDEGRPAGTLRIKHKLAEAMGTDYIRKAFIRAHAADPAAILRYNDYYTENNQAKFEGVKKLLIDLKNQGVPVHALGWQMHIRIDPETLESSFDSAILLARMNEIADLGFDNYISEMDVELPENATAAHFEAQKQIYKTIVETFLKARRHKTIVIWGIHDGDPGWLPDNHPFIFDENFNKKPAYDGVREALLIP